MEQYSTFLSQDNTYWDCKSNIECQSYFYPAYFFWVCWHQANFYNGRVWRLQELNPLHLGPEEVLLTMRPPQVPPLLIWFNRPIYHCFGRRGWHLRTQQVVLSEALQLGGRLPRVARHRGLGHERGRQRGRHARRRWRGCHQAPSSRSCGRQRLKIKRF